MLQYIRVLTVAAAAPGTPAPRFSAFETATLVGILGTASAGAVAEEEEEEQSSYKSVRATGAAAAEETRRKRRADVLRVNI